MASGESDLIEVLFWEFYSPLYRYAEASLKNPDWAEDVVQDVFHEALRHRELLASHENPHGWLMQTLKYKLQTSKRQRRRLAALSRSLEELPKYRLPVTLYEPEENFGALMEQIEQALTEDEFYLLKRLAIDGAGHLEVAKELGITVWTSQKRLSRIREKLFALFPERKKKSIRTPKQLLLLLVPVISQCLFK